MAKKSDPIKQRKDHTANLISKAFRNKLENRHGDFARYYLGLPLVGDKELHYSDFTPSNATDGNAKYIAYKNKDFEKAVLKYFNENYEGGPLRPSYEKNPKAAKDWKSYKSFNDLGSFKIDSGEDEKGKYVSYYDVWNYGRNDNPNTNKTEFLGAAKPFEVYDRIYLDNDMKKTTKPSRALIKENIPEYSLGGFAKENPQAVMGGLGVLAGGALMATGVGGPLGASLISSGIGGIASAGNQPEEQPQLPTQPVSPNVPTFKFGGKYKRMANGGLVEWQGGEPLMTPGGKIVRTPKSMPSHAKGGVVGEVEGGTAFLGQMINPETGNKYMEDGDKLGKIQTKADKILATNKTKTSRNSAILNKKNASMKFDGWVQQQELLKPKGKKTNKMQTGGTVPPTMTLEEYMQYQQGSDSFATDVPPMIARGAEPNNQYDMWRSEIDKIPTFGENKFVDQGQPAGQVTAQTAQTAPVGATQQGGARTNNFIEGPLNESPLEYESWMSQLLSGAPQIGGQDIVGRDHMSQVPNDTIDPSAPGQGVGVIEPQGRYGLDRASDFLGENGSSLASLAPVMFNAFNAMRKPDTERLPDEYNRANALLANRRFNVNPLLDANRSAQNIYDYNLKQSGAGAGRMGSGRLASMAGRMRGDMSAYAQKDKMDNQYMAEQAQGLFGTGAARREVDTANLMNQASRRNMLGSSLSQYSNFAQNRELMGNMGERDLQRTEILSRAFPFYNRQFGDINFQ